MEAKTRKININREKQGSLHPILAKLKLNIRANNKR